MLMGHTYLIGNVCKEHKDIPIIECDAPAEGGLRFAKCTVEKIWCGATRKYCILRYFNVTPPPKTEGGLRAAKCTMKENLYRGQSLLLIVTYTLGSGKAFMYREYRYAYIFIFQGDAPAEN